MIWGDELEIFTIGDTRVAYLYHPGELVNLRILNHIGSANETTDERGTAHILEHMFFKGSKKRPGPMDISRCANDIGAKLNAYTTYEHTCYHISSLRENFAEAADILIDMFLHPLFPSSEYKKELAPILSELREQEDNPESYLNERALKKFFGENYHPIIGYKKTIENSNSEKMFQFKNKYYGSNHSLISVVGDVKKKQLKDILEVFHGYLPTKKDRSAIDTKTNFTDLTLTKSGIQETYYMLLFPSLPAHDPDRFREDLVNYILGGNESSILFERIREELGLSCYGIYSWILRSDPFHLQGISCGIATEQSQLLHQEVLKQLDKLKQHKVSERELNRAKSSIRTSLATGAQTCIGLNRMIAPSILRGETKNPIRNALEQIEKITTADILAGAQKFFASQGMQAKLLPETS